MLMRREGEEFSVSFLDVICCGFGAIILLLMLSKHSGLVVSFGVIAILSLPAHFLLVEADFGSAACRSGGAEH